MGGGAQLGQGIGSGLILASKHAGHDGALTADVDVVTKSLLHGADSRGDAPRCRRLHAMLVLGIETSCDETAASVVECTAGVLHVRSSVVASQEALHAPYGGVVPELASRAHLACILPTPDPALPDSKVRWCDLDRGGVAHCHVLIGHLPRGVARSPAIALSLRKPGGAVRLLRRVLLRA